MLLERVRAAMGGILTAFSFHIAIDSLRNSIITSYGYIWAVAFVLILSAAAWMWQTGERRALWGRRRL